MSLLRWPLQSLKNLHFIGDGLTDYSNNSKNINSSITWAGIAMTSTNLPNNSHLVSLHIEQLYEEEELWERNPYPSNNMMET